MKTAYLQQNDVVYVPLLFF